MTMLRLPGGLRACRLAPFFVVAVLVACTREPASTALAITGVTVIDPRDNSRVPNATIVLERDHIVSVQSSGAMIPRGAQTLDVRGKFVIPGLWDMHVHIQNQEEAEIFFPLLLAHGVLGIRDAQGLLPSSLRDFARRQGYMLEIFGGGPGIGGATPGGPSDVRAIVDSLAALGVDFIKVFSFETEERLAAIIARAQQHGLGVAGHVPLAVSAGRASDLGIQTFEHAFELHLAASSREDELRAARLTASNVNLSALEATKLIAFPPLEPLITSWSEQKAAALFQTFVTNHTWQVPTLELFRVWGAVLAAEPTFWNDPNLAFLPPAWLESWRPERHRCLGGLTQPELEPILPRVRAWYTAQLDLVRRMHMEGVRFLAGTDASQWNWMVPGISLHAELAHLVEAGFSPMDALQTATSNPVEYMGIADSLGSIEPGKRANLVILDADPALSIENVSSIFAVVLRGRLITRRSLDTMLAESRRRATLR